MVGCGWSVFNNTVYQNDIPNSRWSRPKVLCRQQIKMYNAQTNAEKSCVILLHSMSRPPCRFQQIGNIPADQMEFVRAPQDKDRISVTRLCQGKQVGCIHNRAHPLFDVIFIYISPRIVTFPSPMVYFFRLHGRIDIIIVINISIAVFKGTHLHMSSHASYPTAFQGTIAATFHKLHILLFRKIALYQTDYQIKHSGDRLDQIESKIVWKTRYFRLKTRTFQMLTSAISLQFGFQILANKIRI